ncbi:MAG: uroporphyrinogen decarboxylase family protein [Coriobacteriia bacterium]|nr:uroporphyrinogen decarboxylase family protein [Coriobacteriia bacterium]
MSVLGHSRPLVICPGGMMTCSSAEVMAAAGYQRGVVHTDPAVMAAVSCGIAESTGFDNVGVPFCMTVEAEAMGARVDLGSIEVEPLVTRYAAQTLAEVADLPLPDPMIAGRMPVVLEALRVLTVASRDRVVTGNVIGPVSLLTSLIEPGVAYRAMREDPEAVHAALERVVDVVAHFAQAQVRAGARLVMVAEPSGTGDILGPTWFEAFAAPYLARVTRAVLDADAEVVLHICGDVRPIIERVSVIPMTAFSFESVLDVSEISESWPDGRFMGNVSTRLLQNSSPERIRSVVDGLVSRGIDIVAPACGIPVAAPIANVRALASAVHAR